MDCTALELDAVKFAKSAVLNDQQGKYNEAVFYYKVSSPFLTLKADFIIFTSIL